MDDTNTGTNRMAKVKKIFAAESQTGQKLDAPEFHSGGILITL